MQFLDKIRQRKGLVIVLSAPSGAGKDAVLEELMQMCPDITRCITVTTREKRAGEENGKDYYFVSVDEFEKMKQRGEFLEYAAVYGSMYGTPKQWVLDQAAAGKDVILKIDVQGGAAVRREIPEAVMIFLLPPSMEELERRLRNRMTESEDEIARRLAEAQKEIEQIGIYDYAVINDSVEEAAKKLRCIVVAERCRIKIQQ